MPRGGQVVCALQLVDGRGWKKAALGFGCGLLTNQPSMLSNRMKQAAGAQKGVYMWLAFSQSSYGF